MASWERLEDQDSLVPGDSESDLPSRYPKGCTGQRRRFHIMAFCILVITLVLTAVLLSTLRQQPLRSKSSDAVVEATTRFIDDFPEDSNSSELSWKGLDLPGLSPEITFVEEIISLFAANDSVNSVPEETDNVVIFYETLSKASRDFMVHQFFPTYAKLGRSMSVPVLVPYGNANLTSDGNFSCEHGYDECQGNLVHGCALHQLHEKPENGGLVMAYIGCMMNDMDILTPAADAIGQKCARIVKIPWEPIFNCTQNGDGHMYMGIYKSITDRLPLFPKPLQLPIVVVSGTKVSPQNKNQFFRYMCQRKGNRPEACKKTK